MREESINMEESIALASPGPFKGPLYEDSRKSTASAAHFRRAGGNLTVYCLKDNETVFDAQKKTRRKRKHAVTVGDSDIRFEEEAFSATLPAESESTVPVQVTANDATLRFAYLSRARAPFVATCDDTRETVTYRCKKGRMALSYHLTRRGVKETLTLYDRRTCGRYRFLVESGDLTAKLSEDRKKISFCDRNGVCRFETPAPYMTDAAGESSSALHYELRKDRGQTVLTVVADKDWLHDEQRVYPVVIDPEICVSDTDEVSFAESVTLRAYNAAYVETGYLRVGYDASGRAYETYMQLSPPDIHDGVVRKAELVLTVADSVGDCTDSAYRVMRITESWNPNAVSYQTRPDVAVTPLATFTHGGAYGNEIRIDLTETVRNWYSHPTERYGIALLPPNAVCAGNSMKFFDETASLGSPRLEITYTDRHAYAVGHPEKSFENGRAGTTTLDMYTGDLVHVHTDIALDGVRMPLSLSHVYRASDRRLQLATDTFNPYGKGWTVSAIETLTLLNTDGIYAVYRDGAGYEYCFRRNADRSITDDLALGLTLTSEGNTYIITDKQGNYKVFNKEGRIVHIRDVFGNGWDYSYTPSGYLNAVTDGCGRTAAMLYSTENGRLSHIRYQSVRESDESARLIHFDYNEDDELTKITYPDGTFTEFVYTPQDASEPEIHDCFATVNPETKFRQEYVKRGEDGIDRFNAIRTYTPVRYQEKITDANGNESTVVVEELEAGDTVDLTQSARTYTVGVTGKTHEVYVVDESGRVIQSYTDVTYNAESDKALLDLYTPATAYQYAPTLDVNTGEETFASHVAEQVSTGALAYKLVRNVLVEDNTNLITDGLFLNEWFETDWTYPAGSAYVNFCAPTSSIFKDIEYTELEIDRTGATAGRPTTLVEQSVSLAGKTLTENALVLSAWMKAETGSSATDCKLNARLIYSDGGCTDFAFAYDGSYDRWQLGVVAIPLEKGRTPVSVNVSLSLADVGSCVRFANVRMTNEPMTCVTYDGCRTHSIAVLDERITVTSVTYTDGHTTQIEDYDCYGNCVRCTIIDASSNTFVNEALYYGGKPAFTHNYRGMYTDYTYSAEGALLRVKTYHESDLDTVTVTQQDYDAVNDRYTKQYGEDGKELPSPTAYDRYGHPITLSGNGITVNCTYDTADRLLTYTATAGSLSRSVTHTYTSGRQTKVTANGMYYDTRRKLPMDVLTADEMARLSENKNYAQDIVYIGTAANKETAYGGVYRWPLEPEEEESASEESTTETPPVDTTPTYDGFGRILRRVDKGEGKCYNYYYDRYGHVLCQIVTEAEDSTQESYRRQYAYDNAGRPVFCYDSLTGKSWRYTYEVDGSGRVYPDAAIYSFGGGSYNDIVTRDHFGRITGNVVDHSDSSVANTVTYATGTQGNAVGAVTTRPIGYTCVAGGETNAYTYTYDTKGNITHVYRNGVLLARYTYDDIGQLVREDNAELRKSFQRIYDDRGNVRTRPSTYYMLSDDITFDIRYVYGYSQDGWSDQVETLPAYSTTTYEYDAYGNPTLYLLHRSMSWQNRLLMGVDGNVTFTYNDAGIRISKTGTSGTTTYTVDGTRILKETRPDNKALFFRYGVSGDLVGFTYNGTAYYYGKNLFGDIVDIYDANGNKVAHYAYDAWGNHTVTNYGEGTIGDINPFRYRGYYYDTETQLYYLQTRYYDPVTGRFLNADALAYLGADGELRGYNLYTYCGNNPVMYVDPTGHFAISTFLIGLAASALIGWVAGEIFGHQLVGGVSSTIGGGTAIATGISLFAFGPVGIIIGLIAIAAGVASIAFGTAEIQEHFTGNNWIQDSFGWSDGLYNGLYFASNIVASLASVGGTFYRNSKISYGVGQADKTSSAYSRYYQMNNGKVQSITQYGKGGLPKYRIDVLGDPHFIKRIQQYALPHIHPFGNYKGFVIKEEVDTIRYWLWLLRGNWR